MEHSPENLPKVPPFITPEPPRNHRRDLSQRRLLSPTTLLVSLTSLTIAMVGGAKLAWSMFDEGLANSLDDIWAKIIVLGLAYAFGWLGALVCIRVFDNLVFPIIINLYAWLVLMGISGLYLKILQKLYLQAYDGVHFWAYILMMVAGFAVLIGLHLIVEGHDLRPFAIPLLIISVFQLFLIVFRYVFTSDANPAYLSKDLFFFSSMVTISGLMLAHLGVLAGLRHRIDSFFRANGHALRPEI